MPILELYHSDMAVCSQKVRLVLAAKGLPVIEHTLDIHRGDQFDPAYLKLNPNAVVPTLVVDGTPVLESTLIAEYLDEAYPDPSLKPADLIERAKMRRFALLTDQGLHGACGTLTSAIAFRKKLIAMDAVEREAHFEATPDPARRERKRETFLHGLKAPGIAEAFRVHVRFLEKLDGALSDGATWIAGGVYSLAEACLTPYVVRLDQLGLSAMWRDRPAVAAWLDRVREKPNYAGIADYLDPATVAFFAEAGAEAAPEAAVSGFL